MGETEKLMVYGHPMCWMVLPVRELLEKHGVEYEYVDIHADPEASQQVRAVNDGHESVPTLVFPDGTTLTEPGPRELLSRLESLGLASPSPSLLKRLIEKLIPRDRDREDE